MSPAIVGRGASAVRRVGIRSEPRIGVVAPLIGEAASYARRRLAPGGPYQIGGQLLYISGIGASRAERACSVLLDAGISGLVSWGTAAALASDLACGSLLLPAHVYGPSGHLPCSDSWRAAISQKLESVLQTVDEPIAHCETVLQSQALKRACRDASGAGAADMESAVIAAIAKQRDVPFVALRAVSDTLETRIPDIARNAVDAYGRAALAPLAAGLLRQPGAAVQLLHLARGFRRAILTLRRLVDCLGPGLAFPI